MANVDRYLMGLVNNLENLHGTLSQPDNLTGHLANATLRGMPVEIRLEGTLLQWKYEDETEWRDLIDLSTIDYETLSNLPLINGVELVGDKSFEDLGIADEYATKHEGVTDITRDGTTFTVTRADGETFTFEYDEATFGSAGLMSSDDKIKLDAIEDNSQENIIESISVNGDTLPVSAGKNVDIFVPTVVSELLNDSNYQTDEDVAEVAQALTDAIESLELDIDSRDYQSGDDVSNAIAVALADITGIKYKICGVDEYDPDTLLPTVEGEAGVIYMVPKVPGNAGAIVGQAVVGQAVVGSTSGGGSGSESVEENNIYIEYIYNGCAFEKIGDTRVDLQDYFNTSDLVSDADLMAMLEEIGIA